MSRLRTFFFRRSSMFGSIYKRQIAKSTRRENAKRSPLRLGILAKNPFEDPPPFEKLVGDLAGAYSRRINIRHRLVYQVLREIRTVKVIRMWTHYE